VAGRDRGRGRAGREPARAAARPAPAPARSTSSRKDARLMKRLSAVSIPVLLAALCSAPALADRWQAIEKLAGTTPVEVLVHGKSREYFRVASQAPLIIPIQGPARVRIVSRAEVPQGSRVVTYTLRATEAGKAVETLDTETSAADDIRLPS